MSDTLDSMCMTYRHDFGLLSDEEKEQTRNLLRGIYNWHVKPLEDDADKFKIIERAMEQLESDEREGGIWTACSLLLISSSHTMNSSRSTVEQEGVSFRGEYLGDWRVTVERINK